MQRLQFLRDSSRLLFVWPLAGLLCVGILWGVTFSKLHAEKLALQQHALQEASDLAQAQAEQATRAMEKLDELTMRIKYDWEHSKGNLRLPQFIELGIFDASHLAMAAVIGKDGLIQTASVPGNESRSFKDRAYFQFHSNNNSSAMYVGKPVIGSFSHRLVVQTSRRLESANGDFDGVAMVSVTSDYFAPFFVGPLLGKDGLLALIGNDGVVRTSAVSGAPGATAIADIYPELAAQAQTPQLFDQTWFVDQQARFVAAVPLKEYPFTAIVGLAENQVMAPYEESRKTFIRLDTAGSLLFVFFVLAAMLLSVRLAFRKAQAEEFQRAHWVATEGGNEGFYMWQAVRSRSGAILDFKVVDCNERGAELYGMKKAQLMGKRYSQLYHSIFFEEASAIPRNVYEDGYLEDDYEVLASSPLRARWLHRKMVRTRAGWAVTLRDISQIKANEQAMMRMATEDALTGLPNRHWLLQNLPGILARAGENGSMLAILFIDLDDFKDVNDSLGHLAGDELLKATAQRLRSLIRPGDSVVRLGGDEFTIVLDPVTGSDIETIATRIVEAFKAPFELSQGKNFVGTSIGIGVYPMDGADMETLLKNADIAMYSAKTSKGNFCFFTAQLHEQLQARLTAEKELMRALEDDEFVVHYQPRVATRTGEIVGLEALVRWNHPTRGEVQPGEFISVAEKTDIILRLGAAVVDKVCAQLAQWQSEGVPVVPVSINVAAKQFNGSNVKELISDCLQRYAIRAELLEIELTESMMMGEGKEIMAELEAIRALGIRIHVDDFGTGYSSLALLQRLKVDVLKVDRAFTSKLDASREGEIFFRAIVSIAHALNMDIVAEGVETLEQLHILQKLGCDEVQGFYISRPLSGEKITPLMIKGHLFPVTMPETTIPQQEK
ncbi:MAG: signal transduction protein [Herbaspirillum sp.]|nr:signal transduction protein [Herbaspirillum sp.]